MNILFICTANVCRSPLAEGYLKSLTADASPADLIVSSAGIAARDGSSAFECAMEVAKLHQFDLTNHRARQLTVSMIEQSDRIFCMESWQAAKVMDVQPKLSHKVALLGSFYAPAQKLFQISDPRLFDVDETLRTFGFIKTAIDNFIVSLK
jgi:protein-tyrosine-phosphatase